MKFSGLYTALVTPFNGNKSIDYIALDKLFAEQVEARVDGLVILGTTGESPTVDEREGEEIVKRAVKASNGKVKIIMGTGSNDTKIAVQKSKKAQDLGADAILCVNPYYNKPTQEGLYQHFMSIADGSDIPMILYNIKGRTAVNLEIKTLMKLAQHERIVGIKEASGDLVQIMNVIKSVPQNFAVLSGDDVLTYPIMCLGGHGVVSVASNVLPMEMKNMVWEIFTGNFDSAKKRHYKLYNLMISLLSLSSNPIPIKSLLAYLGKIQEEFRLPLCSMSEEAREELVKHYEESISG
ncbi:4-hydroxy-tetrahydrodipicolinate synthase [Candidatus Bandiella euplotis]|uniref:4-hydroxy-tetrahydrodipicolinate synthase n=1 Tax=Candidatus Bandiella euplotis TaxID=1664265 RepID=A0ABZ0UJM2_9RICK|nr:4-hydroxy-tetrahydrodipicolinate synthase [Candidatus Bandiella woodruffii]WPX96310.1 4-hydroxy-tetrahydrodipicolinate synthase [Candidatus Bandiella woodruffii]